MDPGDAANAARARFEALLASPTPDALRAYFAAPEWAATNHDGGSMVVVTLLGAMLRNPDQLDALPLLLDEVPVIARRLPAGSPEELAVQVTQQVLQMVARWTLDPKLSAAGRLQVVTALAGLSGDRWSGTFAALAADEAAGARRAIVKMLDDPTLATADRAAARAWIAERAPDLLAEIDAPQPPVPTWDRLSDARGRYSEERLAAVAERVTPDDLDAALRGVDVGRALSAVQLARLVAARTGWEPVAAALARAVGRADRYDAAQAGSGRGASQAVVIGDVAATVLLQIIQAAGAAAEAAAEGVLVSALLASLDRDGPELAKPPRGAVELFGRIHAAGGAGLAGALVARLRDVEATIPARHNAYLLALHERGADDAAIEILASTREPLELRARIGIAVAERRPLLLARWARLDVVPWEIAAGAPRDLPVCDRHGGAPDAWIDAVVATGNAALVEHATAARARRSAAPTPRLDQKQRSIPHRWVPPAPPAPPPQPAVPARVRLEEIVRSGPSDRSQIGQVVNEMGGAEAEDHLAAVLADETAPLEWRARAGYLAGIRLPETFDRWVDRDGHVGWRLRLGAPLTLPVGAVNAPLPWAAAALVQATEAPIRLAAFARFASLMRSLGGEAMTDVLAAATLLVPGLPGAVRAFPRDGEYFGTSLASPQLIEAIAPCEANPAGRLAEFLERYELRRDDANAVADWVDVASDVAVWFPEHLPRIIRTLSSLAEDARTLADRVDARTGEERPITLGEHALVAWIDLTALRAPDAALLDEAIARSAKLAPHLTLPVPLADVLLDPWRHPGVDRARAFGERTSAEAIVEMLGSREHTLERLAAAIAIAPRVEERAEHPHAVDHALQRRVADARTLIVRGSPARIGSLALESLLALKWTASPPAKRSERLRQLVDAVLEVPDPRALLSQLLERAPDLFRRGYAPVAEQIAERLASVACSAGGKLDGDAVMEVLHEAGTRKDGAPFRGAIAVACQRMKDALQQAHTEPGAAAALAARLARAEAMLGGARQGSSIDAWLAQIASEDPTVVVAALGAAFEVGRGDPRWREVVTALGALLEAHPTDPLGARAAEVMLLVTRIHLADHAERAFAHAALLGAIDRMIERGSSANAQIATILDLLFKLDPSMEQRVPEHLFELLADRTRPEAARMAAFSMLSHGMGSGFRVRADHARLVEVSARILGDAEEPGPLRVTIGASHAVGTDATARWCDQSTLPWTLHEGAPPHVPLSSHEAPDAWLATSLVLAAGMHPTTRASALRLLEVRFRVASAGDLGPVSSAFAALLAAAPPGFTDALRGAAGDLRLREDQDTARALFALVPAGRVA